IKGRKHCISLYDRFDAARNNGNVIRDHGGRNSKRHSMELKNYRETFFAFRYFLQRPFQVELKLQEGHLAESREFCKAWIVT
ncbi:hypothetical protein KI387_013613, partial [Taxus chinensis]